MKTREEFDQFVRDMVGFELTNARQKIRSLCQGLADALEADAERRLNTIAREVMRMAPVASLTPPANPVQPIVEQPPAASGAAETTPQEVTSPEAA